MRSLIDPKINYGKLQASTFARLAIIVDGTLRLAKGEDVDFVFDIDKKNLYTVEEVNSLGVPKAVIQVFVKLDKQSDEIYKTHVSARQHLVEIVEYEVKQRLIESNPKYIAKQNFELTNVWVEIIPSFCDFRSVVRHKFIEAWNPDGQRFPFGIGLSKFYDELKPVGEE